MRRTAKWMRAALMIGLAFRDDFRCYLRESGTVDNAASRTTLRAAIIERYHALEKGMSLPSDRAVFGGDRIAELLELLGTYTDRFGHDDLVQTCAGVFEAYIARAASLGATNEEIPRLEGMRAVIAGGSRPAGLRQVAKADVLRAVDGVDVRFFDSRASVRQFAGTPVSAAEIRTAVQVAATSPAVCNRRFNRIHVLTERHDIDAVLAVQGGTRGFTGQVEALAVVTSRLGAYWNATQRNQAWVDGGMFAMSFVYGLHAQGLGSVLLHWSSMPSEVRRLRALVPLADDEVVVCMVGFGHLRDRYAVAYSTRPAVDDVLVTVAP
jgi:nitroreductase